MSSWDVEELYGSSGKWTLESDKRVFLKLEEMSQRIADKLGKIDRTLFEIERQSEYNFVDLNNTFNRFLMLSDAQFIENVQCFTFYSF